MFLLIFKMCVYCVINCLAATDMLWELCLYYLTRFDKLLDVDLFVWLFGCLLFSFSWLSVDVFIDGLHVYVYLRFARSFGCNVDTFVCLLCICLYMLCLLFVWLFYVSIWYLDFVPIDVVILLLWMLFVFLLCFCLFVIACLCAIVRWVVLIVFMHMCMLVCRVRIVCVVCVLCYSCCSCVVWSCSFTFTCYCYFCVFCYLVVGVVCLFVFYFYWRLYLYGSVSLYVYVRVSCYVFRAQIVVVMTAFSALCACFPLYV